MSDYPKPLPRLLTPKLQELLRRSRVVVLTGARQTGKTMLVQSFAGADDRQFVTLDRLTALDQARHTPEALIADTKQLIIDEVQGVPELLLAVMRAVDEDRRKKGKANGRSIGSHNHPAAQGSSLRPFAARTRSSRNRGSAIPISASARSRRLRPNRQATPCSVTT
jgi:hypothetical protein